MTMEFFMEILLFLNSFLISLILIPILRKYGEKKQFFDRAEGDKLKIHKKPISFLGGLAMLIAFIAGLLFFGAKNPEFICKISAIMTGSLIIFLFGFWDDIKWKHISSIKPKIKFLLLIIFPLIAGFILLKAGIGVNFFSGAFDHSNILKNVGMVDGLNVFDVLLVGLLNFLYIFVFINGVNYQDGMDGLAGGLVLISLIGFIVLSSISGNNFILIISLILLGSVFAFLLFNQPLAKIFMGDSGAYFLGFVLAVIAMFFSKQYNILSILGPIFIVGMPVWDGVFTNIRRILKNKSIFLGDRLHFYDRLLQKGYSIKKTLLISYFLQIVSVAVGLLIFTF